MLSHAAIKHVHSDAGTIGKCIAKSVNRWASHPRGFPSQLLQILLKVIFRNVTTDI